MTGRLNFDEDDSVTVVQGPTLRWVTKSVVITSELHMDQYGNWHTHDVVEQQRVLQQAVMTDKAPGHMWVDVPEVDESLTRARTPAPAREATPEESGE